MHPVSFNWSYVKPFRDACVATGMNMGSGTSPCGRWSMPARAFDLYFVTLVVGRWFHLPPHVPRSADTTCVYILWAQCFAITLVLCSSLPNNELVYRRLTRMALATCLHESFRSLRLLGESGTACPYRCTQSAIDGTCDKLNAVQRSTASLKISFPYLILSDDNMTSRVPIISQTRHQGIKASRSSMLT